MSSNSTLKKDVPVNPSLTKWHEYINEKVQLLIKEEFPLRVIHFNELLESEYFDEKYVKGLKLEINIPACRIGLPNDLLNHEATGGAASATRGRKRKHGSTDVAEGQDGDSNHKQNDMIPGNRKIKDLINIMKPQIKQLVEETNLIKLWVMLLIPRIEDGNNFGVSVQEDILEEVRNVEGEAAVYYDEIVKYHHSRAKIVSKIAKYPFIEDYRETLTEVDEKQWLHLQLVVKEMRNHYNSLYNLMTKNWEKLICPRSSNSDAMF